MALASALVLMLAIVGVVISQSTKSPLGGTETSGTPNAAPSRSESGPGSSPTSEPSAVGSPSTTHTLSGTFKGVAPPRATTCPPIDITITAHDEQHADLGSGDITLTLRGTSCQGSFSFPIHTSTDVTIGLRLSLPSGPGTELVGPTYSTADLERLDYHLELNDGQFAENSNLREADLELAKVIKASLRFHDAHGTFVGLDAAALHRLVPSVTFNDGDASVTGEVSVREVTSTTILFVVGLPDGVSYCRGLDPPVDGSFGYDDVQTYDECLRWQGTYPTPAPQVL